MRSGASSQVIRRVEANAIGRLAPFRYFFNGQLSRLFNGQLSRLQCFYNHFDPSSHSDEPAA